jgi:hypothetical protein
MPAYFDLDTVPDSRRLSALTHNIGITRSKLRSARRQRQVAALSERLAALIAEHTRVKLEKAQRLAAGLPVRTRVLKVRPPAGARPRAPRPETPAEAAHRAAKAQRQVAALAASTGAENAVLAKGWELQRQADPRPYHESPPRGLPDGFYDDSGDEVAP